MSQKTEGSGESIVRANTSPAELADETKIGLRLSASVCVCEPAMFLEVS